MAALSAEETLITRLFDYRFSIGRGLKGHSFGTLFLTAMTHLTGDFPRAVQLSSEVLAVAGRIYPSTGTNVALEATLAIGRKVRGKTRISATPERNERVALPQRRPRPPPETLEAMPTA